MTSWLGSLCKASLEFTSVRSHALEGWDLVAVWLLQANAWRWNGDVGVEVAQKLNVHFLPFPCRPCNCKWRNISYFTGNTNQGADLTISKWRELPLPQWEGKEGHLSELWGAKFEVNGLDILYHTLWNFWGRAYSELFWYSELWFNRLKALAH